VARVAERFSEEDLARFMQIMLRTHSELGYKQEQRFHLELGLLKLVHAQRLLPLEALLSGEAGKSSGPARPLGSSRSAAAATSRPIVVSRPSSEAEPSTTRAPAASPFSKPSPFEADRNRKSGPKAEVQPNFANAADVSPVAAADSGAPSAPMETGTAIAVAEAPAADALPSNSEISAEAARNAVLAALADAGHEMLAHNLEEGEWSLSGGEVSVKVGISQVLIDVALGPEPKRIIQTALSKVAGRLLKFKMVCGTAPVAAKPSAPRPANGAGARSRAQADPVVQRMQEKFGAEIRTVIDQKGRG
jgi:DNA polymerase III subunit gamma/tau